MTACKLEHAANMVLMLMRDDYAGNVRGRHAFALQAPLGFADGEAAIQHDGGTSRAGCGGDQKRISFTAAS